TDSQLRSALDFTLLPYATLFRSWRSRGGDRRRELRCVHHSRARHALVVEREHLERVLRDLHAQVGGDHLRGIVGTRLVGRGGAQDRKSTRLNSSHVKNSYAVFCL